MPTELKHENTFNTTPNALYEALMDSKKHSEFSGAPAEINREIGGKSSYFSGHIMSETIELVPNSKIVLKWRAKSWAEGHYSNIVYTLMPVGEATKLTLEHTNIPADALDSIAEGWETNYWKKLREYFKD